MAAIFDDQLVPDKATSQAGVALPANWESQCQCVQTYELMSSAEDWKLCDGMLQKSMQVTITNVTRIQNLWLWEAYSFSKLRMSKRNHGTVNEMHLFHGTRRSKPIEIACGEDGLDVRFSKGGSWGYAIYLSESAEYAHKFAYQTTTGEKELIIAKALIGDTFDYGLERNTQLKVPPIKQRDMQNMVHIKYDSVAGITKNTRVYMIYDNNKTYPLYIVRYKVNGSEISQ